LWTIGHSTHVWSVFVGILNQAGTFMLVDVRRFAGSRRNPQFGGDVMHDALAPEGIGHVAMPELGGRRTPSEHSHNTVWRNTSFRGYADYMEQADYAVARERLATIASTNPTAIMCAEAVWWRCHRSLIADDFKSRGWEVLHLLPAGRTVPHPYTSVARIVDGRLVYGDAGPEQGTLL
jgi:uncharacterized protein (DUF488 family)